ncbi:hypothetical protein [Phaeobacter inhibens]|uniref:hypothetical protein n=1 Tax=Phaeobacter inhibens TaxID=221822 RepID=UPI0021A7466D|nr:hypothetical protein [Phaeobacter inhibens]UWR48174.1 hypothetical protein K4F87_12755 [Phaeobacter inhibens]
MGSVVTAFVQNWLSLRTQTKIRVFQERKEAYIGLLEAWLKQENSKYCEASFFDVGHWVLRAELVASPSVFSLLKKWQETDPGSPDRIQATNDLKTAMRHDLR